MGNSRNHTLFVLQDIAYLQHKGCFDFEIKKIILGLNYGRRGKGPIGLPELDLGIDFVLHGWKGRVGEYTAATQGPGTDFHSSLEPADNLSMLQQIGGMPAYILYIL